MKQAKEQDPYLLIMRAAARGVSLTLSASEVAELSRDSAIVDAACNVMSGQELDAITDFDKWANVRVRRIT